MWIEKVTTKSGTTKFKYCEQYIDNMTGKKKRVSVTLEKNNRAAKRMAEEALARKIAAALEPPEMESLTVKQACERYLESKQATVKASSHTTYETRCNAVIRILGGETLLNRLNARYIEKSLLATDEAPTTRNDYLKSIRLLLSWCYKQDYIKDVMFLQKIEPVRDDTRKRKIQDKYLEPEELAALIDALPEKRWRLLTRFLALSGLRFGEAAALNREDIDFNHDVIHVTKNYDYRNRIVTSTKTDCSERDVYMQQDLRKLCKEIINFTWEDSLFRGYRTALFITSIKGKNIGHAAYYGYLKRYKPENVKKMITPHTLRHTYCSLMAAAGVDLDTISRQLGHESIDITREVYFHVTKDLAKQDAEQIEHAHIRIG
ncbi:MAG: site-specific integrase [Tannerellaceae bacterium]|nr:site-specific integrase [Tannerellaceae bacterium]